MARKSSSNSDRDSDELKGWKQIAAFLGQPVAVVQRWASEDMPVRRQGRFVTTTPKELNDWMGKQSGKPVHVVTDNADLTSELKRAVSFARRDGRPGMHDVSVGKLSVLGKNPTSRT